MSLSRNSRSTFPFSLRGTLLALVCSGIFSFAAFVNAQITNTTITLVTNPPAGGTIAGAGTYPTGIVVSTAIQANQGWYIKDVLFQGTLFPPEPGRVALTPREQFIKTLQLLQTQSPSYPEFDASVLTFLDTGIRLGSDSTQEVVFATLSPTISKQPTNQTIVAGGAVSLVATASGRWTLRYQWQKDGQILPGKTSASLVFNPVDLTNAGTYTLIVTNDFGATNSTPANLVVKSLGISANGKLLAGQSFTGAIPVSVGFQSSFANGTIFYTLDGSTPDFTSTLYTGSFSLTSSRIVRAIAYSADFLQSVTAEPVTFVVLPSYSLNILSYGGGGVTASPSPGPYLSNTVVTVTATPAQGWAFMGWDNDLTGTNPVQLLTMNGHRTIRAIFGTALSTTIAGNGSVSVFPMLPLYPAGFNVQVIAIPAASNYFVLWGNAASGNQNPLSYWVNEPNKTITALFAPLPAGEVSLSVQTEGGGSAWSTPSGNKFSVGSTNTLTAQPIPGQAFLGWSGDAQGMQNPLTLVLESNKTVIAHFTKVPTLVANAVSGKSPQFQLFGIAGFPYRIEASTNLSQWETVFSRTNFFSEVFSFSDPLADVFPYRMYRAVTP